MIGGEREARGARIDIAELDARDAAAGLVLQRAKLDGLCADQALIADQVELVGAGQHVVEAAMFEVMFAALGQTVGTADQRYVARAVDRGSRALPDLVAVGAVDHLVVVGSTGLAVDHGLAKLERVEDAAGRMQRDRVGHHVDVCGRELRRIDGHVAGHIGRPRQDNGPILKGGPFARGQLDIVALVGRRRQVVFKRNDDVGLARVEPADAVAAARRIVDSVLGDDDPVLVAVIGVENRDSVFVVVDEAPWLGRHLPQRFVAVVDLVGGHAEVLQT